MRPPTGEAIERHSIGRFLRIAFAATGAFAFAIMLAACSSSTPDEPLPTTGPSPTEITETITAPTVDGILYDIRLTGAVLDHDEDGSYRDEITFIPPDAVEFQGHFPSPDGDLVIATCFRSDCGAAFPEATFTIQYWTLAE